MGRGQAFGDVELFQTAASHANVLAGAYEAVLELPLVSSPGVRSLLETGVAHHRAQAEAFNAQAEAAGGERQDAPNPRSEGILENELPGAGDLAGALDLCVTLGESAYVTYAEYLHLVGTREGLTALAEVLVVEAQHIAVLRAVAASAGAGAPDLLEPPVDLAAVPAAAASSALPPPAYPVEGASDPEEGAVG